MMSELALARPLTLPEVCAMSDTGNQIRLLQRVVTMCIKEYYSA